MQLAVRSARPTSRQALIIALVVVVGVLLSYVFRSSSTYTDDSLNHYLIARWSWRHPELLLDRWGRPGFTILYAAIAPLGLTATHVFSSLLVGLASWLSARLAKAYEVRWYWLAAIFAGLQPELMRQGVAALTELSCAIYLAIAMLAYKRQRWAVMALAAGLMPLARYETLPILLFFAVALIKRRRYWQVLLLGAPLLAWNGFWAIWLGEWPQLLFPFDQVLFPKPGATTNYGSGPPWHYLVRLPAAFGCVPLVLAAHGFARRKVDLLHLCVFAYIAILSIGFWLVPAAQIAGYPRHLAIIGPLVGAAAAIGFEAIAPPTAIRWQRWLIRGAMLLLIPGMLGFAWVVWRTRGEVLFDALIGTGIALLIAAMPRRVRVAPLAAAALLGALLGGLIRVEPFPALSHEQAMAAAAAWFVASPDRDRVVLGANVWFPYAAGLDPFDPAQFRQLEQPEIVAAPVGSLLVWDSTYSPRLQWQTPLAFLRDDPRFQLIREDHTAADNGFDLYIFRKIAP